MTEEQETRLEVLEMKCDMLVNTLAVMEKKLADFALILRVMESVRIEELESRSAPSAFGYHINPDIIIEG